MEDEIILKIEHVSKEYMLGVVSGTTLKEEIQKKRKKLTNEEMANKSFTALDDVNAVIHKGEAVGLVGHNGAGKSTLLKLISRITAPTKGKIYIGGRVASLLEVGTGFHPELTGRQNIYLNGSILGMSREEIDKKIDSIIEFSECADFIDTPVKRYSSGMYVKLAFSVAAHLDAEIMIMDEVLAVGDMKFQAKCLNKIKELVATENRTVIYVSHYMETIEKLCNRCIVLDHGKVEFDGETRTAIDLYFGYTRQEMDFINLENVMRDSWLENTDARFQRVQYLDSKSGVYSDASTVKLLFEWKNNKRVDQLGLCFILQDQNANAIAFATTPRIYFGEAGEITKAIISVDISRVMSGQYRTYYEIYTRDAFGKYCAVDSVYGMPLTIKRTDRNEEDSPDKAIESYYGHIKLDLCIETL